MTHDYPDHTRLFHLVGTEITIPINIEASEVTIPVSIDAAPATVNINLSDISPGVTLNVAIQTSVTLNVAVASSVTLNVAIQSSAVTINVAIASAAVTLNISFSDQSVAVFDAAKWFAHKAQQVFVDGSGTIGSGSGGLAASRTVPAGRTYFVTFLTWACEGTGSFHVMARLAVAGPFIISSAGSGGGVAIFDTPVRAVAGQAVTLYVTQWSGSERTIRGSFGGYDEIA